MFRYIMVERKKERRSQSQKRAKPFPESLQDKRSYHPHPHYHHNNTTRHHHNTTTHIHPLPTDSHHSLPYPPRHHTHNPSTIVIIPSHSPTLPLSHSPILSSTIIHSPLIMGKDVESASAVGHATFQGKDYHDPPPVPLIDPEELAKWSFYRAVIAEFVATLLFLYITILTVIGYKSQTDPLLKSDHCNGVGILGIAWSFGGMIFILVYCTAGISGGHINPAVTFGLFIARKVSLVRAVMYMVAQSLGAIAGVGLVKSFQSSFYSKYRGGANELAPGYSVGTGLAAEIIGTFVLVYTVFSATDPKRNARDSHVPVLAPLPIGFAVFMVHLATIPITGTGINPARSLGAAVVFNDEKTWDDHWIFWVGPFIGATIAAFYHQFVLRAGAAKALGSFRSNPHM